MDDIKTAKNNEDLSFIRGMDNLIIDTTSVSWIDGKNNKLYFRGIDVTELATHSTFEETSYLIMCGHLPSENQLQSFSWKMRQMMHTQEKVMRIIQELPRNTQPLFALQTALASLASIESSRGTAESESLFETSMRIVAQTPVIIAAAYRHSFGIPFVSPREDLNYPENFLYMLTGKIPSKHTAKCMQISLILQMDNGFTPSTFSARLVASTLTNIYSAACAAVAALSGKLVGGSCLQVFEFLQELKTQTNVEKFVRNRLDSGEQIFGLGHRVYEESDPRANILETLLQSFKTKSSDEKDFLLLKQIIKIAQDWHSEKSSITFPNVDFWSGLLFQKFGLSPNVFPAITAASRVAGWTAHIMELRADNCLYRPRSLYKGPIDVPYIPIEQR